MHIRYWWGSQKEGDHYEDQDVGWWTILKQINPSGRTGPGVDSASKTNEYQESLKIKKSGGKVRPARRADNLAAIYRAVCLSNVGALTSRNPMGLHGL
jgi:hypothetical protein